MPSEITVKLDPNDVRKLQNSIERLRKEMGLSIEESTLWGGVAVSRSIAAATKVAQKRRPVEPRDIFEERVSARGKQLKPRRRTVWGVERYVRGTKTWVPLRNYPQSKADANKSYGAQIWNRGLAKMAWWWANKRIGGHGVSVGSASGDAKRRAYRYGEGIVHRGANPSVTLQSKLDYATEALRGGPAAVSQAFEKASRGMIHRMVKTMKQNGVTA
jgi:hypothetical protein